MSVTIRKASSDDLGIIHDIRRDAILGISDDFGVIERQAWADGRQNSSQSGLRLAMLCLRFLGAVGLVGEAVQETTSAESTFVRHQAARELVVPSCRGWNPTS